MSEEGRGNEEREREGNGCAHVAEEWHQADAGGVNEGLIGEEIDKDNSKCVHVVGLQGGTAARRMPHNTRSLARCTRHGQVRTGGLARTAPSRRLARLDERASACTGAREHETHAERTHARQRHTNTAAGWGGQGAPGVVVQSSGSQGPAPTRRKGRRQGPARLSRRPAGRVQLCTQGAICFRWAMNEHKTDTSCNLVRPAETTVGG